MLYAPFSRDRAAVPRPMGSVTAAGERFFISTTRDRVKYKIFKRDPRVELIIDDATGHRSPGCQGQSKSSRTSQATS